MAICMHVPFFLVIFIPQRKRMFKFVRNLLRKG
jgi:hypothetical protein